MKAPQFIHGMPVLQYGELARPELHATGDVSSETQPRKRVHNVALCRVPDNSGYCTVFCDERWGYMTSQFNQTLLGARQAPEQEYDQFVEWHFPGYSITRLFPVAQNYVVYSSVALVLVLTLQYLAHMGGYSDLDRLVTLTAIVALAVLIVSMLAIWMSVGYAATKSGGWLYGSMHMVLVVALTPVCLVGLFVVPGLVASDLERWFDWNEDHRSPSDGPVAV